MMNTDCVLLTWHVLVCQLLHSNICLENSIKLICLQTLMLQQWFTVDGYVNNMSWLMWSQYKRFCEAPFSMNSKFFFFFLYFFLIYWTVCTYFRQRLSVWLHFIYSFQFIKTPNGIKNQMKTLLFLIMIFCCCWLDDCNMTKFIKSPETLYKF